MSGVENIVKNCKFCNGEPELYDNSGSWGYYPGVVGYKCSGSCGHVNPGVYYDGDEYKDYDSALIEATHKWNVEHFKPFLNDSVYELISALQMCRHFMAFTNGLWTTDFSPEELPVTEHNLEDIVFQIDNTTELEAIDAALKKVM